TAPNPLPDASHSTTNSTLKFGNLSTGDDDNVLFNVSKEVSAAESQWKAFFFNKLVSGAAISP
ncbi:hypothetical protein A2U01_0077711, partial [Trifolium medium]|nr:hypothetical protein [Trifolium medium]